ncbi:MAG: hypothetical protein V4623_01300 [Pseudomonadota bacterium]
MKKAPCLEEKSSATESVKRTNSKFMGTENPRHLRAIDALLTRPMPREHLDLQVGCSNSPELIAELRRRGLAVPCERVPDTDRDGKPIKRGVYHLIKQDRSKITRWLASRQKGQIDLALAGLLAFAAVCAFKLLGVL